MVASLIIVRYIFLDRDGVLNRKLEEGAFVSGWDQFQWLPGAVEAVARMTRAGWIVMVVTNQRGIALGRLTAEQLEGIHANMRADLERHGARLAGIYYCPHDRGECQCRKPGTGLFEQAQKEFPQMASDNSVVIGDSLSDIQAGKQLGMKTIFIRGEASTQKDGVEAAASLADAVAGSLLEAVEVHLGLTNNRGCPISRPILARCGK
jgi:D-glycero-D-manno-heptose 1,7-bisphosphate phosphatase